MRGGEANGELHGIIYFCNDVMCCNCLGFSDKEISRPDLGRLSDFIS
jgi:hypothetical protein